MCVPAPLILLFKRTHTYLGYSLSLMFMFPKVDLRRCSKASVFLETDMRPPHRTSSLILKYNCRSSANDMPTAKQSIAEV